VAKAVARAVTDTRDNTLASHARRRASNRKQSVCLFATMLGAHAMEQNQADIQQCENKQALPARVLIGVGPCSPFFRFARAYPSIDIEYFWDCTIRTCSA
jgi:hypothetical protein